MEDSERSKYDDTLNKTLDLFYEINETIGSRFAAIEQQLQTIYTFIEFHLGKTKPDSSAASSTPSEMQDSNQSDKTSASFPASAESPDHKSPPSQT